jgi:hypothetical protein
MLVELSVVEQRYHAVMEVLVSGVPVTEVVERLARPCGPCHRHDANRATARLRPRECSDAGGGSASSPLREPRAGLGFTHSVAGIGAGQSRCY